MQPITLPITELKPALTGLGKVISKRCTLPVLGMVKIERTADGWIALTGTDLDSFVTVRMEQPAEGNPLSVLVPFEELQTSSKSCGKNESIQIHQLAGDKVAIKTPVGASWAETRCDSVPVDEFPALPKFSGDLVPIPDAVRESLHEAMECASEDCTRLILNGAYIDVSKKDCHCVVGTDGRHLYSSNSFNLPMKESVIIPSHRFLEFKDFNHDGEWRLKFGASPEDKNIQHLQISSRRWRFITRQLDGNYPNWRQVVPKQEETLTTVEVDEAGNAMLLQAIQRMPDHDPMFHTIGLAAGHGALLVLGKANKEDAEWINVPIPAAKVTGKDVRFYVNRELLTKALRFGLTRLEFIDPLAPLRLVNDGRQMVVMPIRAEVAHATTPSNEPAEQGNGNGGNSEPQQPAIPTDDAPAETNETPPSNNGTVTSSTTVGTTIEDVLADIDTLKESLGENLMVLKGLGTKLKLLQKEQKASVKEVQQVRQTLKSLQAVKL